MKRRLLAGGALTRRLRHTFPPVSFKAAASKHRRGPLWCVCMLPAQVDNSTQILPLSCLPPPEMIKRGSVRKVGPPKGGAEAQLIKAQGGAAFRAQPSAGTF